MVKQSTYRALCALREDQRNNARTLLNSLAKNGPKAQARIALVNAACEHVHRTGRKGYAEAWKMYSDLGGPDGLIHEVDDTTFINVMTRQSSKGQKFDVFDVAIVMHEIRDGLDAQSLKKIQDTLTPYQQYLINWSWGVLRGETNSPPRVSDDKGSEGVDDFKPQPFLDMFFSVLQKRNKETNYWQYLYAGEDKVGFTLYRHGLNRKSDVIQTYLNISSNNATDLGVHTYAHFYKPRRGPKGRLRRISGFAIPTLNALYLVGFQSTLVPTPDLSKSIDLAKAVEVIAIPTAALNDEATRLFCLTLTSNEQGEMVISRCVLRRTPIQHHDKTQPGFYEVDKLGERLGELYKAEAGEEPDEADLELEIDDILAGINNLVGLQISDFLAAGPRNEKTPFSGAKLLDEMVALFGPPSKPSELKDENDRDFSRRLHWRLGGIGRSGPPWD